MSLKTVVLGACLVFAANATQASDEVLTVRASTGGGYEAVVTGLRDNVCAYVVNSEASVSVSGFVVSIVTPPIFPPPCFTPISPPELYSATVPIGALPPGQYTVNWTQEFIFDGTAQLTVPQPSPIPSGSVWSTALLALVLTGLGALASKARRSS